MRCPWAASSYRIPVFSSLTVALYTASQMTWSSNLGFVLTQVQLILSEMKINAGLSDLPIAVRERWRLTLALSFTLSASYDCSAHSVDLFSPRSIFDYNNGLNNSTRCFSLPQYQVALLSRRATSTWFSFRLYFFCFVFFYSLRYRALDTIPVEQLSCFCCLRAPVKLRLPHRPLRAIGKVCP